MIEVKDLSYRYPDGKQALRQITFSAVAGEKIAILGANGAGKSTLLYHLNGIFLGEGSIRVDGMDMNKHNLPRIRARVGVVFQNPDDQLFSPTVFEDVAYGPTYQGYDKAAVRVKVEQALAAVNMGGFATRNPYHLSGGEKKRIAIAAVLSMQPGVLVLDEPSAGLDPRARRELIELLQGLPQTMLIATHDLDLAERLTTRALVLHQGSLVEDTTTREILHNQALLMQHGLF